ncbi:ribosomal-protein-alanine N-acetyltransferase [Sinobaca qinghaiensis]|uniref:Ribosomal-protein-alanine N-acetyltransferase n=1 Tax=Sinobaca qinghaiensis TaxID=342944 RepID=A0A419V4Z1_9BACL|nr:GNAT family N-acetyltransferase [Sinobaca qinghaiensis]RKD73511.1 ribosomal-protein-alanine N-acetyltransferase [Sinobaca qinghaiensis]
MRQKKSYFHEQPLFYLRTLKEEDAADVWSYLSRPEVVKHYGMEPLRSVQEAVEEIQWYHDIESDGTGCRFGIVLQDHERVIGSCGFHNWHQKSGRAEVAMELHPSFWGLHIMTHAMHVILEYGFRSMNLEVVTALVKRENLSSQRLMEKLDFQQASSVKDGVYTYYAAKKDRQLIKDEERCFSIWKQKPRAFIT